MSEAKFILSKRILLKQVKKLQNLGLKTSYSYKTNNQVGQILQEISSVDFSIHTKQEIESIKNKSKIWFFAQAESAQELQELLERGISKFVVDNEQDLNLILETIKNEDSKIQLSLRMKFQENRVGTGKYFVYGMPSHKINELILELKENKLIEKLGIHIHRKTQNTSEWEIKQELEDSLTKETLEAISFLNIGGGLPTRYRSYTSEVLNYIFEKLKLTKDFLSEFDIETYIEPGRFLAGPCIKLETKIIQIQGKNLIINTSIYQCALDSILTGTKMLIDSEIPDNVNDKEAKFYLIKGNSPTRDDIFRYKVKLKNPKVGDKIIFLNAGAYNYTTDFFGYNKLKTEVTD
jgi:ornithine decarboxylase